MTLTTIAVITMRAKVQKCPKNPKCHREHRKSPRGSRGQRRARDGPHGPTGSCHVIRTRTQESQGLSTPLRVLPRLVHLKNKSSTGVPKDTGVEKWKALLYCVCMHVVSKAAVWKAVCETLEQSRPEEGSKARVWKYTLRTSKNQRPWLWNSTTRGCWHPMKYS